MPDEEKLITVKRLSTDIIIPSNIPQNKRKATILPKSSIKISINNVVKDYSFFVKLNKKQRRHNHE